MTHSEPTQFGGTSPLDQDGSRYPITAAAASS